MFVSSCFYFMFCGTMCSVMLCFVLCFYVMFVILMFIFNFNVFVHHCSRIFRSYQIKKKKISHGHAGFAHGRATCQERK